MTTMTITLPDDRLRQLQELAARFHVAPEDLLRVSLEEMLTRPDEPFQQAVRYILEKKFGPLSTPGLVNAVSHHRRSAGLV